MGLFEALRRLKTLERIVVRLCQRVTALERANGSAPDRESPSGVNPRNDEKTISWKRGEGEK